LLINPFGCAAAVIEIVMANWRALHQSIQIMHRNPDGKTMLPRCGSGISWQYFDTKVGD